MIREVVQELRRDEEVLAGVLRAGDLYHTGMYEPICRVSMMCLSKPLELHVSIPLVARIHSLVDLVDYSERCSGHTLQSHEVENRRHSTLAARLTVVVQHAELFIVPVVTQSALYTSDGSDPLGCSRVPELDLDLDLPLFKVIVFVNSDLAGTLNALKVLAECVRDLFH